MVAHACQIRKIVVSIAHDSISVWHKRRVPKYVYFTCILLIIFLPDPDKPPLLNLVTVLLCSQEAIFCINFSIPVDSICQYFLWSPMLGSTKSLETSASMRLSVVLANCLLMLFHQVQHCRPAYFFNFPALSCIQSFPVIELSSSCFTL